VLKLRKIKTLAQLIYNVVVLLGILSSKTISEIFDGLGSFKLEIFWFSDPVYLFDDFHLRLEKSSLA